LGTQISIVNFLKALGNQRFAEKQLKAGAKAPVFFVGIFLVLTKWLT